MTLIKNIPGIYKLLTSESQQTKYTMQQKYEVLEYLNRTYGVTAEEIDKFFYSLQISCDFGTWSTLDAIKLILSFTHIKEFIKNHKVDREKTHARIYIPKNCGNQTNGILELNDESIAFIWVESEPFNSFLQQDICTLIRLINFKLCYNPHNLNDPNHPKNRIIK